MSDNPQPGARDCQGPLHPLAVKGLQLFNQGEYWLAHEALEEAWRDEPGEIRHLYRGILQVGVAYFHILRCNYVGAIKLQRRSHKWLDPFPAVCRGIDVAGLKADFQRVMDEVHRLGPEGLSRFDPSLLKPVHWSTVDGNELLR